MYKRQGIELADIEINKSDIDEVNDVIQETDEEAYALYSEFTEEKEYKTCLLYTSSLTGAVASERVSEALKGSLRMVGNHLKSAKAEGSLSLIHS